MEFLESFVAFTNDILWSYVLIVMLVGLGIWFSLRTRFVQVRCLKEMVRLLKEGVGQKTEHNHISSFQAFCVSTASRVGVGNIAGIAIAIVSGGPGAIFWMWIIAILGSATGFIESTLAANLSKFRVKAAVTAADLLIILRTYWETNQWRPCLPF